VGRSVDRRRHAGRRCSLDGEWKRTAAARAVGVACASRAHAPAAIHVRAVSGARLLLRTSVAGLTLDGRGRPQITGRRDAASWLRVQPRSILAGPNGANFVVTSRRAAGARPGDHTAIVLLTATAPARKGIAVAMRVGLVVTVRVSGRSIRRIEVVAARARAAPRGGRLIAVTVANRGERIESIGGARLAVTLLRRGRIIGRFRVARRLLLPRTRAVVAFRTRAAVHGPVVARVAIVRPDGGTTARTFRLRL
jgi:hypothetical protein